MIANAEQLRKPQRLSKIGTRPFSSVARLYWNLKGKRRTTPRRRTPIVRTKSLGICPPIVRETRGAHVGKKRADNQSRAIGLTRNDAALSPCGPCERLRTRCPI